MIKLLEYIQEFRSIGDIIERIKSDIKESFKFSIQTRNNDVILDYLNEDSLHIRFIIKVILDNSIQFHEIMVRDQTSYRQVQLKFKELCLKEERLYLYQGERIDWYCKLCSYYLLTIKRDEKNKCFDPEYIKSLLYEIP